MELVLNRKRLKLSLSVKGWKKPCMVWGTWSLEEVTPDGPCPLTLECLNELYREHWDHIFKLVEAELNQLYANRFLCMYGDLPRKSGEEGEFSARYIKQY